MTQEQKGNATKEFQTKNVNEIEPFQRFLFVLSHENNDRQFNDFLYYCISELRDRTYSSLSHACESDSTIKMLTLCVLER